MCFRHNTKTGIQAYYLNPCFFSLFPVRQLITAYGQFPSRLALTFMFMVCPWVTIFMVAS